MQTCSGHRSTAATTPHTIVGRCRRICICVCVRYSLKNVIAEVQRNMYLSCEKSIESEYGLPAIDYISMASAHPPLLLLCSQIVSQEIPVRWHDLSLRAVEIVSIPIVSWSDRMTTAHLNVQHNNILYSMSVRCAYGFVYAPWTIEHVRIASNHTAQSAVNAEMKVMQYVISIEFIVCPFDLCRKS